MTPAECPVVGEVDLYPGASLDAVKVLGWNTGVSSDSEVGCESGKLIDIRCGARAA